MRKLFAFVLTLLFLSASPALAGRGFPLTLGGMTLGEDIHEYASEGDLQHASPMPDAPFLSEMHLRADLLPGVRGGSLTFANCREKDKLVRIKLKFHDRDKSLFDRLLKRYRKAFGEPDSYEGDTFRNVIAWQWTFKRGDRRVSLLLMWSRDREIRPGVSIKMTLESLLDGEYACYKARMDRRQGGGPSRIKTLDAFVPR